MPPRPPTQGYKRSWKNLLINKRYQLQFTLFMVGLSSLLMLGLGLWVVKEANEATAVGMASVRGVACGPMDYVAPKPGSGGGTGLLDTAGSAAAGDDTAPAPAHADDSDATGSAAGSAAAPAGSAAGSATGSAAGSAAADAPAPARHRPHVQIDEEQMTMVPQPAAPVAPPPTVEEIQKAKLAIFGDRVCAAVQHAQFEHLEFGRLRIFIVLVVTGLALVVGLAMYGIKMTHKVAGPLFKVTLYLNKMREGRFDKVWNLRKGDQLVDFYDHFKAAHAGMVTLEKTDIDRLKKVIATAEASGLGEHETVDQLRAIVARKEKALE